MDKPVELIPLNCTTCGIPLPANPDEVAWVCPQCGKGSLLFENKAVVPITVNYSAQCNPAAKARPFWVAEGTVSLQRSSYGIGSSDREAQSFWAQPRRFFIPAYPCALEEMLSQAIQLLAEQPPLQAGAAVDFAPVTQSLDDLRSYVEFVVMAVEAGRKDKLKELSMQVDLQPPVLWILP